MAAIRLKKKHHGFTMLPNRFIDEYMPLANGEYVKVYLYLLRQANLSEPHVSVEDIAEHLMHTEKDIIRALKYWEKQGLLVASFTENRECDSIELLFPENTETLFGRSQEDDSVPSERIRENGRSFSDHTPEVDLTSTDHMPEDGLAFSDHIPADGPAFSDRIPEDDLAFSEHIPTNEPAFSDRIPEDDLAASAPAPDPGVDPEDHAGEQDPASKPSASEPSINPGVFSASAPTAPLPRRSYTPQEIEEITERESLEEMIFVINSYMGRPLSQAELSCIIYFYDQLGFSIELIEYLFEYCISKNHKNIRYIEKTALNWAEEHISTPDEARQRTASYSEYCFAVLRAFGISGRNPVESEVRFVKIWREDYHMSAELIMEACSRTMAQIHSPSFEYADGILSSWKKAGVRTLKDVKKLDAAFAAKKQSGARYPANRQDRGSSDAAQNGIKGGSRSTQTKFSNFEERSYSANDDADMEKLLISRYRGQKTGT